MKIAVTYENGQVYQHFGHTEAFKIYEVENGAVVTTDVVYRLGGNGHGALAALLEALQVDVLICGGIGGGAQAALSEVGIRWYGGVSGDTDAAVNALLAGALAFDPNAGCNHHGESHGCGDHDCGSEHHSCGHNCGGHHE